MKKLTTAIAALLLFAGISNAANTTGKEKTVTPAAEASSVPFVVKSFNQLLEENAELKIRVEQMSETSDNLQSELDYGKMMHATIKTLNAEISKEKEDDVKSQLDYARMMNTTLINLHTVALTGK